VCMGNGAGCGSSAAKVVPVVSVQQAVDVQSLVLAPKARHFPTATDAEAIGSNQLGECLLFLEQVQGARGHVHVCASVVPLHPDSSEASPNPKAGHLEIPRAGPEADKGFNPPDRDRPTASSAEDHDSLQPASSSSFAARWPPKCCSGKSSWYSAQSLQIPMAERDKYALLLEIWDQKTLLGKLQEPLGDVPEHCSHSMEVIPRVVSRKMTGKTSMTSAWGTISVSLQILNLQAIAHKRTVFFVRHAESVWNAAQSKKHYHKMARETDHPLSVRGARQAKDLSERLATASNGKQLDPELAAFLKPDIVYTSPLTRAVQTAVLALGPSLTEPGGLGEVAFMPNAREKHNFGGMDTVSKKTGVSILYSVLDKLRSLTGELKNDVVDTFAKLHFDISEVEEQWWTAGSSESSAQVHARTKEFMAQLLYSPHRSAVVVGHSHFFRSVISKYLAEEFKTKEPSLSQLASANKLMNCGVLCLELDPLKGLDNGPITDMKLILGSEIIK